MSSTLSGSTGPRRRRRLPRLTLARRLAAGLPPALGRRGRRAEPGGGRGAARRARLPAHRRRLPRSSGSPCRGPPRAALRSGPAGARAGAGRGLPADPLVHAARALLRPRPGGEPRQGRRREAQDRPAADPAAGTRAASRADAAAEPTPEPPAAAEPSAAAPAPAARRPADPFDAAAWRTAARLRGQMLDEAGLAARRPRRQPPILAPAAPARHSIRRRPTPSRATIST